MSISTQSYDSISQKYRDAIQWMNGLGIKLDPGRTSYYEKILGYWKDTYRTATEEEGKNIFPDFVSSMYEIHDFIDIFQAFNSVPNDKLKSITEKLQKGVNGPINMADETPNSTAARNYIFEALVAARCHRSIRGVEAILDAKSDTGIKILGKKIWVECKRISSVNKIEANISGASKQVERILKDQIGSGHRGVVAIDISKILNPGDKILVRDNDAHIISSADEIMDKFIKEYSHYLQRIYSRRSKKIIGTIIRFSFMSTSEERNLLVHTSQWAVNPRGSGDGDEAVLRSLVSEIREAIT